MNLSLETPSGGLVFALVVYGLTLLISLLVGAIIKLIVSTLRRSKKVKAGETAPAQAK